MKIEIILLSNKWNEANKKAVKIEKLLSQNNIKYACVNVEE